MSARDQDDRLGTGPEVGDDDYGDDLNLDRELERVIKHLDEATAEPQLSPEPAPRPRKPEPPLRPVIPARAPVPARDPKIGGAGGGATVLLTERLEPRPTGKADVIDLLDEIDGPGGYRPPESPKSPSPTVASMTAEELGEVVASAVERALRRFYSR
jgi:hypothetical protein